MDAAFTLTWQVLQPVHVNSIDICLRIMGGGTHIEITEVDAFPLVIGSCHPAPGVLEDILLIKVIIQLVSC